MLKDYAKRKIDDYIKNLVEYYNNCEKLDLLGVDSIRELTEKEKEYLNNSLNLQEITGYEKQSLINNLLRSQSKANFALSLLYCQDLSLVINEISENKSTFIYLFENLIQKEKNASYLFLVKDIFSSLYKRNYTKNICDGPFLKKSEEKCKSSSGAFAAYCIARIAFNLDDYRKFEIAINNDSVLFAILSFRYNRPLGSGLTSLKAIANNSIMHYRDKRPILIKAMHIFNVYEKISIDNKVLKEAEKDMEINGIQEDDEFNKIIIKLFPNLK